MYSLLAIFIDVFAMGVIWIPLLLIFERLAKPKGESPGRKLLLTAFGLYLAAVFSVTGIPGISTFHFEPECNYIPFLDIINAPAAYLKNTVLNLLLFVPLGVFAPILWRQFWSVRSVALLGFLLSVTVEISQLFNFRLTDVDDMITNTVGTLLGYFVVRLVTQKDKGILSLAQKNLTKGRMECVGIVGSVFLLMFFIVPYLAGAVWLLIL